MATYNAHVGDVGRVLVWNVAGATASDLTGAVWSVRVTKPSGVVETWTVGFTGLTSARLQWVIPRSTYLDEEGTWKFDATYTLGAVTETVEPILFSVGPGGVAEDGFLGEISSGVVDENGNKLYGEGFFVSVLGTGSFVLMFEDNVRLEASTVFHAWAQSTSLVHASMAWASGNMAYVYLMDSSGAAVSVPFAFLVEDAT